MITLNMSTVSIRFELWCETTWDTNNMLRFVLERQYYVLWKPYTLSGIIISVTHWVNL